MTQQHFFTTFAGIVDTVKDDNKAIFSLMTDGSNRNQQGLTKEAMVKCLKNMNGTPLRIGKNYRTGHNQQNKMCVGKFLDTTEYEGYAIGTAEITDPHVAHLLKNGELGPISWQMIYQKAQCSNCGTDLSGQDWHQHGCIKNGSAYSQLFDATIVGFDFVDQPAYPDAGFKKFVAAAGVNLEDLNKDHSGKTRVLRAYADLYEFSQQQQQIKEEKMKMSTEQQNLFSQRLDTLEPKLVAVTAQIETLTGIVNTIQEHFSNKAKLDHAALVEEAYTLRAAAGVAAEASVEKTKLSIKTDAELEENIADAKTVIANNKAKPVDVPQADVPPTQNLADAGVPGDKKPLSLKEVLEAEQKRLGYKR
ncbi:MAG: hypothetical protein FWE56_01960 [Candidatus Bathyarchaeota archaeon]|nr:hypothetical protein [Candidatus Termiticorpusculum sp.]MCL2868394.1 hypothetical protein [Candidatus Termiticorpusculum sp.]